VAGSAGEQQWSVEKLDVSYWVTSTWKFQTRHLLLATGLRSHVKGSDTEPSEENVQSLWNSFECVKGPVRCRVGD